MNGNHDIGDKKISRFQFLKLLGASAIGYFAYRAGFINSLIRSAAAAGTHSRQNKCNICKACGEHKSGSPENDEASCWNVNWYYEPTKTNVITFEYTHPDYERGHDPKFFNMYKSLGDRWFGYKVVSMVRPDQSARDIVTYFNEDPLDLSTGLPKNDGWKNYFEFTHTGQGPKYIIPHTWGGAKNTCVMSS
jgi:hypothetical protein